jgi:hypothetical protein
MAEVKQSASIEITQEKEKSWQAETSDSASVAVLRYDESAENRAPRPSLQKFIFVPCSVIWKKSSASCSTRKPQRW